MPTLTPDTEVPDFELADLAGEPVRLSQYRGSQHVILTLLRGLW